MEISKINPSSWIDPRLETRKSPIHGRGVFTKEKIAQGEVIIIFGGTLFSPEEILAGKAVEHSFAAIADGVFLGHTLEHGNSTDDFVNHSCDPNVWMLDEITVAARRDIAPEEEITADLVMWWEPDEEDVASWACNCGSQACRKVFTSQDWRIVELQEKYKGHLVPYISERIKQLRQEYFRETEPVYQVAYQFAK